MHTKWTVLFGVTLWFAVAQSSWAAPKGHPKKPILPDKARSLDVALPIPKTGLVISKSTTEAGLRAGISGLQKDSKGNWAWSHPEDREEASCERRPFEVIAIVQDGFLASLELTVENMSCPMQEWSDDLEASLSKALGKGKCKEKRCGGAMVSARSCTWASGGITAKLNQDGPGCGEGWESRSYKVQLK